MTASLIVLVSISLFALIGAFCFVGCILDTSGTGVGTTPKTFTTYTDFITEEPGVVAFWPLNEPTNSAKANDVIGGHSGDYTHKGNAPDLFPCPAFQVSAMGPIDSAAANGFLETGATGIVTGDAKQPGNDPEILATGMTVDGGFVSVPLPSVINPGAFSVEAWVRPEWTASPAATRAFVDSRSVMNGAVAGFVLWVNNAGNYEALFNGSNGAILRATAAQAAIDIAAHVVLTFDGTSAIVYVDGVSSAGPVAMPAGSTFNANTEQPMIIGAGFRFLPLRTVAKEDLAFPLIPFKGTIQDVAVYDIVLDAETVATHFDRGSGKAPAG